MLKVCTKCFIEKNLEDFSIHKGFKDGRDSKCKLCKSKAAKDRYNSGITLRRSYTYNSHLRKTYNIDIEDYNKMLKKQNGICAICFIEAKLVVDHCHITKKVRGLLCHVCNTGLGKFQDDVMLLEQAISYLKRF